jgi:hypothetical protein
VLEENGATENNYLPQLLNRTRPMIILALDMLTVFTLSMTIVFFQQQMVIVNLQNTIRTLSTITKKELLVNNRDYAHLVVLRAFESLKI